VTARILWFGLWVTFVGPAWGQTSQDGVDDLFVEPAPDISTKSVGKTDLAALNTSPFSVAGHVNANTGALMGTQPVGFFNMGTDFTLEARPDPSIRYHALLGSTLANLTFPTPSVTELWVDYTLLNTYLFRMGKYTLAWGQGRIFNPGDLMADSPNGVTLKAFAPVLGQSLTGVILGNPGIMVNPAVPEARELSYAGQLSGDVGRLGWGVAGLVRPGTVLAPPERNWSAFGKSNFYGIDFYVEGVVLAPGWQPTGDDLHYLAGFFWEGGDPKWQLQGEATDTRLGAAAKLIGWFLTPFVRWEQSRLDDSGTVQTGFTWLALPHLTLDFGVPWLYGSDTSEYLVSDTDPNKQRLGVAFRITLDAIF